MKVFWWSAARQLYAASDRYNWGPVYRPVEELLAEGYHEISINTALSLGWPV